MENTKKKKNKDNLVYYQLIMLIGHGRYALLTKGEVKMPGYWPNLFL